jgi:cytochrome d ubiquinol oxidase subunit I
VQNSCDVRQLRIPGLTSYLATGDTGATLQGVKDIQAQDVARYGPGDYKPLLPVTYWSFRLMIGFGAVSAGLALVGLWVTRRGRLPSSVRLGRVALWAIPAPFLANAAGWIFTEMGRQPWAVAPNPTGVDGVRMLVRDGVSHVGALTVLTSLVSFAVVYTVLAVVWFGLVRRYVVEGLPVAAPPVERELDDQRPLSFAY